MWASAQYVNNNSTQNAVGTIGPLFFTLATPLPIQLNQVLTGDPSLITQPANSSSILQALSQSVILSQFQINLLAPNNNSNYFSITGVASSQGYAPLPLVGTAVGYGQFVGYNIPGIPTYMTLMIYAGPSSFSCTLDYQLNGYCILFSPSGVINSPVAVTFNP